MEQQEQSKETIAPSVQSAATSNLQASAEMFKEGLSLLRGVGVSQDFAMASARLLDADDLNHPVASYYCALLYYCGVGVARNVQTANSFASKYIELNPEGIFLVAAKEIIDGTLGTENARKLLLDRATPVTQAADPAKKKKMLIVAAVGVPVVLIALVAVFALTKGSSSTAPASVSGITVENLLPKEEVDRARQEALSIAATLQADAQAIMQKQKLDQEAQEKAEQAQLKKSQDEAKYKAEQGSRAGTETTYPTNQQTTQHVDRQSNSMVMAANQAVQKGEFDRANGILDAVLASDPNNQQALSLKASIKQTRSRAVNNLQIR